MKLKKMNGRRSEIISLAVCIALGFAMLQFCTSAPVSAQTAVFGGQVWKDKAPCRNCHGSFGNGVPDVAQSPSGANLRNTQLSSDQIAEVIKCGRPGTRMPYFDRNAYTSDSCYGMTKAQAGDSLPDSGDPVLTDREIQSIAMFIPENFVGKGDPTFEECTKFWGPNATTCSEYPHAK